MHSIWPEFTGFLARNWQELVGSLTGACLQFDYIAIAIYGWWNWLHGGLQHRELEVETASASGVVGYLAMAAAATAIL